VCDFLFSVFHLMKMPMFMKEKKTRRKKMKKYKIKLGVDGPLLDLINLIHVSSTELVGIMHNICKV